MKPNRQPARSRKLMQHALLSLLREKTYAKITITAINQRANLSRRTFYEHFESKDDLLISLIDDMLAPTFAELTAIVTASVYGTESEIGFVKLFQSWQEHQEVLTLIRNTSGDMIILNRLCEWFNKMYVEAVLPQMPNNDPTLGAYTIAMVAGATFQSLMRWTDFGMRQPPELMGRYLFAMVGPPTLVEPHRDFATLFDLYAKST